MLNTFEVNKVLIIAPLRVARDTWPAEIEKWDHLKGLDISVIVGDVKTRIAAVHHPAIIYIVNRENIKWLVEYYEKNGMRWDFGMVVIDELSSFKNYQSQRFKYLRKVRPFVKRWVGLTGTPSSNGLMDLWAEIGILDGGERLGKFIGRYDGIGIAVGNGIGAFDLDDCFREDGTLNDTADTVLSIFPTAYVEKSPSGKGLRGFFHVAEDYVFDKTVYYISNRSKHLEVYMPGATNRFVTVTGDVYRTGEIPNDQTAMTTLLDSLMKRNKQVQQNHFQHHSYLDDEAVIRHAEEASNSEKFKKLYGYCGFISIHSNGIPKTSWNIEYELREIAKAYNSLYPECQLPNLTPHVLRHTFCTRKVSSGMNIKAVQYLMGHSSVQITLDVYTSIDADMIKTEFAKVAQM